MKKFKIQKNNNRIILIVVIVVFIVIFTVFSLFKINKSYNHFIKILLKGFTHNDNITITKSLTGNLDYLLSTYSFKDNTDLVYRDIKHKIYLYNTHDLEKYSDNTTIYKATELLNNNLNKLGIGVIQESKKPSELLHTGLSYYEISKSFIQDVQTTDKDIQLFIDIHRDSVKNTTITINNKKYAKIMFVLGLDNQNYEENKLIIEKMNKYLDNNYPGISRGIYEKSGKDVDGVYNQDLGKNVLLIEIGGIENSFNEINNSTEVLSLMIYDYLFS